MIEALLGTIGSKPEPILRLRVNAQTAQAITLAVTRLDAEVIFQNGTVSTISGDATTKFQLTIPAGAGDIFIKMKKRPGTGEVRFSFSDVTNTRVTGVVDWNTLDPDITLGFYGCQSLVTVPTRAPNSNSLRLLFHACNSFNSPSVVNWKTSHVTNMDGMFALCTAFNQPIGGWDTGNVTSTVVMFNDCTAFNQPIGNWNMSKAIDIGSMFAKCSSFNQNLNAWDTSNVINANNIFSSCKVFNQPLNLWKTGKITNFSSMFSGAEMFNQDISNWDTRRMVNMSYMFQSAKAFNKTIAPWDVSNVTDLSGLFVFAYSFNQDLSTMIFKANAQRGSYDADTPAWNPAYRPKFTG